MVRALLTTLGLVLILGVMGAGGAIYVFQKFGQDLPEHRQLASYEPPVMTRVHAGDGRLLAEYAIQKRVFVPLTAMPKRVLNAFLAAEDKNFYEHIGIDPLGVLRAIIINIKNIGNQRRMVGASTITQQVAKNFLLTNEVSWRRKVKEAILAIRIEKALPKKRILELYLNEIYLGFGAYGVAAAALNYFDKSLDQLSIEETAFLAALPKAPNNYHPHKKHKAALIRRNWVIERMALAGFIAREQAELAKTKQLTVYSRSETQFVQAPFFAEDVRRKLADQYGEEGLYKGGLSVRTTLDPKLQEIANKTLRGGLIAYDRRHGWRGPLAALPADARLNLPGDWKREIASIARPKGLNGWKMAAVLAMQADYAQIGLEDGTEGRIPLRELYWARAWMKDQKRGAKVKRPSDVLKVGDLVAVELITTDDKGELYPEGFYGLRQIPDINGGLVAIDPHTGRVLAMAGGYSYELSQFNRVMQARRQPGSAFKPFVYLAALDSGFTPSTLILDAPFVIDQGRGLPKWRPANYAKKFFGPSTMRLGIEKSRNLMTVRLAQTIGMDKVAEYARRFGIVDNMPEILSMALGAGETTLMRITAGYAMLVNGGKQITPTLIDRIQDRHGRTVFRHDDRKCVRCRARFWEDQRTPEVPDIRKQLTNPSSAFQIVGMLEGVVERGTGRRIKAVGKPLGGKTGTTNLERDTWFVGFSPDLAVGVFAAFDTPLPLGKRETGSSVSAPIFRDFMAAALAEKPSIPFRIPPGVRMVRINARTGKLAREGDKNIILEAFKPGTEPTGESQILEGQSWSPNGGSVSSASGTGGLF
ncbi:MAG: penicillin-binding protein 1A [Rhodospirillales bacterium]|nr:penicillin-binding protein 1A [Rhodospirillales bacterium]